MAYAAVQKHPRFRLCLPVGVIAEAGAVVEHPLEDVSLGGAFIRCARPSPPGSILRLRFPRHASRDRNGGRPFCLLGWVVHVIDEASGAKKARAPGMGVELDGFSPETEAALRAFVAEAAEEERARDQRAEAGVRAVRGELHDVPPLEQVLTDAERLVVRVQDDGFGAVGLSGSASRRDVERRTTELLRAFSVRLAEASPSDRTRLEMAIQIVARLEPALLERSSTESGSCPTE